MEVQTLAELKAENEKEAAELANQKTPEQLEEEARLKAEADATAREEEAARLALEGKGKDPDSDGDNKDGKAGEDGAPEDDWKKADDGADPDEAKFTDGDVAKLRRKLKGKVNEQKDEIAKLRQENEELRKGMTSRQQQESMDGEPDRGDFETESEWLKAVVEHNVRLVADKTKTAQNAEEIKRKMEQQEAAINQATDAHYLRASKLSEKSGISAEAYQAADTNVRKAIDSVFPEAGDKITDALIANLGDGSEKVFYHLGVNATKRAELVKLFQEDRTGIKAAVYLGKLNATLSTPAKRESSAPPPPDDIKGDQKGGNAGAKLKKDYDDAHRKGDTQAAYNIKQKAKGAKIDTSKW